jgi:hypothetical protein
VVTATTTAASDLVSFTCASLVSSNANGGQFQGCWAYLFDSTGVNLSAQRSIQNSGGYDADAGSCTVSRAFSTTVTAGMGIEIVSKLPAITDDLGVRGIREITNNVLLNTPPVDLIPITGVTSQTKYDLSVTYPWLTRKDSILGVYFQNPEDEYPRQTGYSWDWISDADAPFLVLPSEPFRTGETFYLKVRRPAQSWIKTAGVWAADTDGLQDDADEALPLLQNLRAEVLVECYRMLGSRQGPDEYRSFYQEREAFWTTKAYALRWWNDEETHEANGPQFRMVGGRNFYSGARSYR